MATSVSELPLSYFASIDQDIARPLARSFAWQENSSLREDIDPKCTENLSGKDTIIDALTLGRYMPKRQTGKWHGRDTAVTVGWKEVDGLDVI